MAIMRLEAAPTESRVPFAAFSWYCLPFIQLPICPDLHKETGSGRFWSRRRTSAHSRISSLYLLKEAGSEARKLDRLPE